MAKYTQRVTLLVLVFSVLLSAVGGQAKAMGYNVVVGGAPVLDAQAELQSGQLMVAVRPYAEAFGGSVEWSPADQRVTVKLNGSQMAFWMNTRTVFQNGERLTAPVAAYLRGDKAMVPAWWLAVRLGAKPSFSGSTLTVETAGGARPAPSLIHPLMKSNYVFPFSAGVRYETYFDGWGDPRSYQGTNTAHEGTDILTAKGTPVLAVASGTVIRYGWNTLGGYRLTVQLDDYPEYKFYYAHFDRYAAGMYLGARVKAGQVIGYVGNTGQGPERTEGLFVPHLHFGIYDANFNAINPYQFLRYWEGNKVSL